MCVCVVTTTAVEQIEREKKWFGKRLWVSAIAQRRYTHGWGSCRNIKISTYEDCVGREREMRERWFKGRMASEVGILIMYSLVRDSCRNIKISVYTGRDERECVCTLCK